MAGIDYTAIAAVAKTLVDANGRAITVQRYDQDPANASTPWHGPSDVTADPDATASVYGVFVPPSSLTGLGLKSIDADLMKRTIEIAIIAPGTVSAPFDLGTANAIVDSDNVRKKISFVETLKPGTTTLLYFIGVER